MPGRLRWLSRRLGFGTGHDLLVMGLSPRLCSAPSTGSALGSFSLLSTPSCSCSLSKKQTKFKRERPLKLLYIMHFIFLGFKFSQLDQIAPPISILLLVSICFSPSEGTPANITLWVRFVVQDNKSFLQYSHETLSSIIIFMFTLSLKFRKNLSYNC